MRKFVILTVPSLMLTVLAPSLLSEQLPREVNPPEPIRQPQAVLYPETGARSFGWSVSIDGNRVLIGDISGGTAGESTGSAYIFEFDGLSWHEGQKFLASDAESFDDFGSAVSLSGNRALVGARADFNDGAEGSVYVFELQAGKWNETGKLIASDGDSFDWFGNAVSLSGDLALVGSTRTDQDGQGGVVHLFGYSEGSWFEISRLTASDGAPGNNFGVSVSLDGSRMAIGAPLSLVDGAAAGAVYIFDLNGSSWIETAKISAADGDTRDYFGSSVDLFGDRVLIGAYGEVADGGSESGAAYIFDFDGLSWDETVKLVASDGRDGDSFGNVVALDDDLALVGAPFQDGGVTNSGSVYFYQFDGAVWREGGKIIKNQPDEYYFFGTAVALSGNLALIASRFDDINTPNSGAAYIYNLDIVHADSFESLTN